MKYTHDRNMNIVEIDIEAMSKEDLIKYASLRPIWDTKADAELEIKSFQPIRVDTGTGKNDFYYI